MDFPGRPGLIRRMWWRLTAAAEAELARDQLDVECAHTEDPLDACDQCVHEARAARW